MDIFKAAVSATAQGESSMLDAMISGDFTKMEEKPAMRPTPKAKPGTFSKPAEAAKVEPEDEDEAELWKLQDLEEDSLDEDEELWKQQDREEEGEMDVSSEHSCSEVPEGQVASSDPYSSLVPMETEANQMETEAIQTDSDSDDFWSLNYSQQQKRLRKLMGVSRNYKDPEAFDYRPRTAQDSKGKGQADKGKGSGDKGKDSGNKGKAGSGKGKGSGDKGKGSGDKGKGSGAKGKGCGDKGKGSGDKGKGSGDKGKGSGAKGKHGKSKNKSKSSAIYIPPAPPAPPAPPGSAQPTTPTKAEGPPPPAMAPWRANQPAMPPAPVRERLPDPPPCPPSASAGDRSASSIF